MREQALVQHKQARMTTKICDNQKKKRRKKQSHWFDVNKI
jgi:hypothetical protein